MGLFRKSSSVNGWLAINADARGVRAAAIARRTDARPAILRCTFQPGTHDASALEKFGKEIGAARHAVTSLLDPGQYQLLSIDAPNVPAEEMKTAVRWRLKDMLDFPVDDATVDVLPIPADKAPTNRPATVFAVAARNQFVRAKQQLFDAAKTPLRAIDIPELAQRNIAALIEPEGRGLAMLAFDHEGGLLTVTCGGELFLSRRIEVTAEQLADPNENTRDAYNDRITLELQRSLDHFDRQFHTISLAKLVLAPLGAAGATLLPYLASNLYVPVEQFDLADAFDLAAVPELADAELQRQFFLTVGAALRDEVQA